MRIVGFGCTAQVGKDTAAEHLEKLYPGKVKRVAFADKLKNVAMELFGLSWDQCYGSQEIKETIDSRYGMTPREIMQGIGEQMRQVHPEIWVDTVFNVTIPQFVEQGYDCFIISDVRYPNEGDKIHEEGGVVVRVTRKGSGVTVGASHSSETAMQDYQAFDYLLENDSSFGAYFEKLELLMEDIGYGREERQDNHGG
jgi:hypothetical protein